jgi:DNA-directed RNA polymerase subunit alpha
VEAREEEEREIGEIAIDAIYTPIKRVNYEVENMRVGKRTDYDKITLEIVTDGTLSPMEAFDQAVAILVAQFSVLSSGGSATETPVAKEGEKKTSKKKASAQSGSASGGKKEASPAVETE